jgi:hypothetical protein
MRFSWLVILAGASLAQQQSDNNVSVSTATSSAWCANDDNGGGDNNFTLVASVPDRVSVLRLRLEGCTDHLSRFTASRFAVTIEPTRSSTSTNNNVTFVATVPPHLVEPAYARTQVYDSSVGVLSFRLANSTAASPAATRAGIRVRIPFDQLRAVIIDAGSPFYVNIRNGFSRLSSIRIEAGYSLHGGSEDSLSSRGAQLVADLRSSNEPLTLVLDGNGAKVRLRAGSTIESLQISTIGSDVAIQGDIECNPSVLPCYVFGGELGGGGGGGGDVQAPSTVVLLEGSVQGTISTSTTGLASSTNQSNVNETRPTLQIKINDPYYVGDPCNALGRQRSRTAVQCAPTNETVSLDPWFPCTTPLDSDLGTVECSRMDAASATGSSGGVCSCSVKTGDSPGVDPILGTSASSCRYATSLPWLVGVSVLGHAVLSTLY